jgi:type I restriction enzyme, R subunit
VQNYRSANLAAAPGVAVREFKMRDGFEAADYLLFVNGDAVGVIEAKKPGTTLTGVEWQSRKYREGLPDGISALVKPLPFAFESTGVETRFTNGFDPEPASRNIFAFYQPKTLERWIRDRSTLRGRVRDLPELNAKALWPPQAEAIRNLELSLKHGYPRALIRMATGSGKTFTAANIAYRLVKYADARRVLFLVDRSMLGDQTLKEFQSFSVPDGGRKFTELYNVQHLKHNRIDPVSRVVISTIQRLYSVLRGDEELPEELDERSGFEMEPPAPVRVEYTPAVPIETFDVIIVDECHRSIYGTWRQVLDYFDGFMVGLTATPGKQTLGFFNQNLVMDYGHEQAVADGVNVDFDIWKIRTEISEKGSCIDAGLVTSFRHRETRAMRYERLDEDVVYDASALDRRVVAKDQIRTIVREFRDRLPEIFPDRTEVPKTLIFAKDDSHADDIVQIVREEFGKGNEFAAKITYKSGSQGQRPEELLSLFRNEYNPRIAVTVDMIATGTDVKPLECVFFMRMVKSRNYFEQMKGRGVRTIDPDSLRKVTSDAFAKDRFVVIDAVGVTESELNDTFPLERKPHVSFEKLLTQASFGMADAGVASSIASRLARLDRYITADDRSELEQVAKVPLHSITEGIVAAIDPDRHQEYAKGKYDTSEPSDEQLHEAARDLVRTALLPLAQNPELRQKLIEVRRSYEQLIDEISADRVIESGASSPDVTSRARETAESFRDFIEKHKDEITALQILYSRPYRQRLTFAEVKELANAIERPPYRWTPEKLWQAYERLDKSKVRGSGHRMLTDIVSLVRYALGEDSELVPFEQYVNERFRNWLAQQQQRGREFSAEQLGWLEQIRDQIAASLRLTKDDMDEAPFSERGGLGKAYALFGAQLESLLDELSDVLAA